MSDSPTPIKIISGGQTGADISGLRAAKRFGLETGGWMPKGWITEAGPRPEYREMYGMQEHASREYAPRTKSNVYESDVTLIFDTSPGSRLEDKSPGTKVAIRAAMKYDTLNVVVVVGLNDWPDANRVRDMCNWLKLIHPKIINIAGNRESKAPGIGAWVEAYLCEVFRLMGFTEEGVSK